MEEDVLKSFLLDSREDVQKIIFNDTNLRRIKASISQWLITKQKFDENIKHRYEMSLKNKELREIVQASGKADLSRKGLVRLVNNYIKGRQQVETITNRQDIVELFRNGYELIHRIRESLVGREITYRIQYTTKTAKTQGELLEVELTLEQLLPIISLRWEGQTDVKNKKEITNAGELFITNSKIKKLVSNLRKNEQLLEENISNFSGEKGELWDSMVEARNRMIAQNDLNKFSANFGRLYEVFSIFTKEERYKEISSIHLPPKNNTEALFFKILTTSFTDHIPGWQGGDLGWEQLKSVFNSSAGLISNSSIEKTLLEIQNALNKPSKAEMTEALLKIYTTQKTSFDNKVDEVAEKESIAAIKSSIEKLSDIVVDFS